MFTDGDPCCCERAAENPGPHQMYRANFIWTCIHCNNTWHINTPPASYILAGTADQNVKKR